MASIIVRAFKMDAFKSTGLNLKVLYNERKTDSDLQNVLNDTYNNLKFLEFSILNFEILCE